MNGAIYLRKNSKNIRKHLEDMGFIPWNVFKYERKEYIRMIDTYGKKEAQKMIIEAEPSNYEWIGVEFLGTEKNRKKYYYGTCEGELDEDETLSDYGKDCGTDEELFFKCCEVLEDNIKYNTYGSY